MSGVIVELLVAVAVGSGLIGALLALGERVRLQLRIPAPSGARPAVAFAFGSFALGLALLLAGLVGWFGPVPLLVVTAVAIVAGRWTALPGFGRALWPHGISALPLLLVALAPPFFYDSWVYHLSLPWQALQDHAILPHPGNVFSTFPPLAQLIYSVPLAVGATRVPGLIHLVGYVTASAAVASIARGLGASRVASFLAGAALLYLPRVMIVPALPAAEAWSVAAITASVAITLAVRQARARSLGAGLTAGIACAARLQGIPWAVLIGLLGILCARRIAPRALAVFGGAVLIGAAPWWAKNAWLLRDPIAPIGWTRTGMETLWRDSVSNINLASGVADLVARSRGALGATFVLVLPLVAIGLVAFLMQRRRSILLVLGLGVAGWMVWSLSGALDRFLVPAMGLLLAVTAAAGSRRGLRIVSIGAMTCLIGWGAWSAKTMWSDIGGLALLGDGSSVYAATNVSDPYPAFRACASLPQDARLLLVSEPRGFLLPRSFETTSQHDPSILAEMLERNVAASETVRELRQLGFTHLLVNVPEMRRLESGYPILPWSSGEGRGRFVELTRVMGKPVVLQGEVVVFALSGTAESRRAEGR